jgi:hypothetical protein
VSEQQINCPYCLFEIPRAASVCGHCTRDISLIRPVLARLNDVDNELSFFKQELSDLKEVIEQDKIKLQNSSHQLLTNIQFEQVALESPKILGLKAFLIFVLTLMLTILTLDALHWLFQFFYDFNLLFLRVVTVAVPFVVAVLLFRKIKLYWVYCLLGASVTGAIAVLGMLAISSLVDGVPLIPQTVRDWREAVEYAISISSSLFTGFLFENWRESQQLNLRETISLRFLISRDANGKLKTPEWTEQLQVLATAVGPIISAGTTIFSGLRVFMN